MVDDMHVRSRALKPKFGNVPVEGLGTRGEKTGDQGEGQDQTGNQRDALPRKESPPTSSQSLVYRRPDQEQDCRLAQAVYRERRWSCYLPSYKVNRIFGRDGTVADAVVSAAESFSSVPPPGPGPVTSPSRPPHIHMQEDP